MLTGKFWADAAERAIKTAAQTLLAAWPTSSVVLDGTNWTLVGWTVLGATVASVLTSIVGSRVGEKGTASVLPAD